MFDLDEVNPLQLLCDKGLLAHWDISLPECVGFLSDFITRCGFPSFIIDPAVDSSDELISKFI